MRFSSLLAATFVLVAITSVRAAEDPRIAALTAADTARVAAIQAGDRAKLTEIFSDDLRYAHATGSVDTKASYIDALVSGKLKYLTYTYEQRNFTFIDDTSAIMTGKVQIKTSSATGGTESVLGFLAVWRLEKGEWRFFAWQSCRLPAPAPAAK